MASQTGCMTEAADWAACLDAGVRKPCRLPLMIEIVDQIPEKAGDAFNSMSAEEQATMQEILRGFKRQAASLPFELGVKILRAAFPPSLGSAGSCSFFGRHCVGLEDVYTQGVPPTLWPEERRDFETRRHTMRAGLSFAALPALPAVATDDTTIFLLDGHYTHEGHHVIIYDDSFLD